MLLAVTHDFIFFFSISFSCCCSLFLPLLVPVPRSALDGHLRKDTDTFLRHCVLLAEPSIWHQLLSFRYAGSNTLPLDVEEVQESVPRHFLLRQTRWPKRNIQGRFAVENLQICCRYSSRDQNIVLFMKQCLMCL